jgi:hypothetical protein
MASSFSSVWQKIKRAKKHTDDLESEIIAFWKTEPYEIEAQGNLKEGPACYRIKGTPKPLPESVFLLAGDAAHNLRSALDHFAWAAVRHPGRQAAFPVWTFSPRPTTAEWRGEVKAKLRGAPPGLLAAVRPLEAYQAGKGQYIWAITEMDRIDKHRLLIAMAGTNSAVILDVSKIFNAMFKDTRAELPSFPVALKPTWTPIEADTELYAIPANAGPGAEAEPKFTFDVALGEPEVLKGEPVVPALRRLIDEVEGLLKRLVPLA